MISTNKLGLSAAPSDIANSIIAGLVIGMNGIVATASFAAFIYSGSASYYFPLGFKLFLVGTVIILVVSSLFSSLPSTIAWSQNVALTIYAAMTASIVTMTSAASPAATMSTIFAANALAGVLTGVLFLILSYTRASNLVFYLPYPVMSGFLGGVGFLLFTGSFGLLLPSYKNPSSLFVDSIALSHWVPALIATFFLMIFMKKSQPWKWVVFIVGGISLFYFVVFVFSVPLNTLREQGFLLDFMVSPKDVLTVRDMSFEIVDWRAVFSQAPNMLSIALLTVIGIFLTTNGLAVLLQKEISYTRELSVAGIGNILAATVGGVSGFGAMAFTMLNYSLQRPLSRTVRLAGVITGLLCISSILFGAAMFLWIPRLLVGTFLMFLGASMLKQCVLDVRSKLPLSDFISVLLIVAVIAFYGVLQGVVVGMVFSIGFFIFKFSHVSTIKSVLTGDNLRSHVLYDPRTQEVLRQSRHEIVYFQLQNFLFFGNAHVLLDNLRHRLNSSKGVRYVILDFGNLTGLDYSAAVVFEKIKQLGMQYKAMIFLTDMSKKNYSLLKQSDILDTAPFQVHSSYDSALEWCEQDILRRLNLPPMPPSSLEDKLMELCKDKEVFARFDDYFEKMVIPEGHVLFEQGDASHELYYIESGQLTVYLNANPSLRLRTICQGNIVGEIALYTQQPRSASVRAETDCILQKLSRSRLMAMEEQASHLAAVLEEYMIRSLAERLVYANSQLELLRS